MSRWASRVVSAALAALLVVAAAFIAQRITKTPETCEQTVLARAVSPQHDKVAEHIRRDCKHLGTTAHMIVIRPGVNRTDERYGFYSGNEPLTPAVLSWASENELSVSYPRGAEFMDGVNIAGVTLTGIQQ